MKLTIDITPELRVRLLHAQTLDIEVPDTAVPEGWQLEALDNDCIVVKKDGVGLYVASFNAENIASTILHALASDMLAAAPKQEDWRNCDVCGGRFLPDDDANRMTCCLCAAPKPEGGEV